MLSIIISSYKQAYYENISKNIEVSCGIPYEIIRIENPGFMSINEAYNLGRKQSLYEYLLFLHEDVLFETMQWGSILVDLLVSEDGIGIVGLAGSRAKSKAPSAWYEAGEKYNELFLKQYDKRKNLVNDYTSKIRTKRFAEVTVLDGVFLAMKKSSNILFDERLGGFHNYDLAISILSKRAMLKNLVTFEIIISHYSEGNFGTEWLHSAHEFYKLYKGYLPSSSIDPKTMEIIDKSRYKEFIYSCIINRKFKLGLYYLYENWKSYPFSGSSYLLMAKSAFNIPRFFLRKTVKRKIF